MNHEIAIFVGEPLALRPFFNVAPAARAYALTSNTALYVLPFDEPVEAQLQRRYGVGDWPEGQTLMLSSAMQSFAAECSRSAPLGYLETHYDQQGAEQSAMLWQGGLSVIGPSTVDMSIAGAGRAQALRPINIVLRALGVVAGPGADEFDTFGLAQFPDHACIHTNARSWKQ